MADISLPIPGTDASFIQGRQVDYLTLSIVGDVNIRGNVAVVTCKRIQNVVRPDEGGGLVQDSVEFKLGKQGDRWIVESAPH